MASKKTKRIEPAREAHKYRLRPRASGSSTPVVSNLSIQEDQEIYYAPPSQGVPPPEESSEGQKTPTQDRPNIQVERAPIDGPFDENQIRVLTAARRFMIVGHLFQNLCRRLSYGTNSGFEPEHTYEGVLQQSMTTSQERSKFMEASEDILRIIEELSQQDLFVEHERRADVAGRPGISERAQVDCQHVGKYLGNVLFGDPRIEP